MTLAEEVGGGWKEEEDTETPDPGEAVGILVEIEATLDDLKKEAKLMLQSVYKYPILFPTYFPLNQNKEQYLDDSLG